MRFYARLHFVFCFASTPVVLAQGYTNLPPPPPGLFNSSARLEIHNTSVEAAWAALTNFRAYATWNPFVRAAVVVATSNLSLPEQYPVEGLDLYLRTQIPPLPLPVDARTPDNVLATQHAYERITHVQRDLGRLAWKYQPEAALKAERWQALSDMGNGVVLYESQEVFAGPLAKVVRASMEEGLQKGFEAQAQGLKLLLEGSGRTV